MTITTPTRETLAKLTREIAGLETKTVGQLAAQYEDLTGEPTRTRNKPHLIKRVAYLLQERACGGLSKAAELKIAELGDAVPPEWRARIVAPTPVAAPAPADTRDPRLPPVGGEPLRKTYKGKAYVVAVVEAGFEMSGQTFKTLTDVARAIAGRHVSGFRFFGLDK
jgi:hypothetical protein